ncbi:MAG: hypothetical protein Alis3KO_05300 [Aliiglaciecola sp.]
MLKSKLFKSVLAASLILSISACNCDCEDRNSESEKRKLIEKLTNYYSFNYECEANEKCPTNSSQQSESDTGLSLSSVNLAMNDECLKIKVKLIFPDEEMGYGLDERDACSWEIKQDGSSLLLLLPSVYVTKKDGKVVDSASNQELHMVKLMFSPVNLFSTKENNKYWRMHYSIVHNNHPHVHNRTHGGGFGD